MKSSQFAVAEPCIKSASRWRNIAAITFGATLFLGLVTTLEAKKPVKPPPEPPPPSEGGILYFQDGNHVQQIDLSQPGSSPVELFYSVIELGAERLLGDVIPSLSDHDGRWFATAEFPIKTFLNQYGSAVYFALYQFQESGEPMAPFLAAVHETGVVHRINTGTLFEMNEWPAPRWFAGDSKLLFPARKVEVTGTIEKLEEMSKWNPTPATVTVTEVSRVAGSGGFYIAAIEWVEGIPMLAADPELIQWTTELWPDGELLDVEYFTVSEDGARIYYGGPEETGGYVLRTADLLTGENMSLLATDFQGAELNPDGTIISGIGRPPEYPVQVIKHLRIGEVEPEVVPPPSDNIVRFSPLWSPSGQSISFTQFTAKRGYLSRQVLVIANPDGSDSIVIANDAAPIGWRTNP